MRLKELRGTTTMQTLGDAIGVPKGTISNWETGKRAPEVEFLWRLADYFDISLDELIGRNR